jgi:hypothetical protein
MPHTYKNPKKITPEQFFEHDDYIREDDTGVTYFDWKTISARCISPDPNHPAYGLSISEYIRKRGEFIDGDDSGKSQLGFRIPPLVAMGIVRLARKHGITATKYISFLLEHGLITFQKDYHGTYSMINADLDELFEKASTSKMLSVMAQSLKQTISLGSGSHDNRGFTINAQDWMIGAIKSTAMELNCPKSDMAYICVLIAIKTDSNEFSLPKAYMEIVDSEIDKFNFELSMLETQVKNLLTIQR